MSRGTTLTLYKKYNLKMDSTEFKSVVRKYAEDNKKHDYSCGKKKPISEYAKDIPLVLERNPFQDRSVYDEKTGTWKDNRPESNIENLKDKVVGHVDSRDGMYCSSLMEWSFGSSFDCLVNHFNIGSGGLRGSVIEISVADARKMLEAINYILGGNWDDKVATGMNNPYIYVFTEGYNCDSYWKYRCRNRVTPSKTFKIKKDGYDITIKCPKSDAKKSDDDIASEFEINESNEAIESSLDTFRNGLLAFLRSNSWDRYSEDDEKNKDGWLGSDRDYKFMLTYEFWC